MTIKEKALHVYQEMPNIFYGINFINRVKNNARLSNRCPYDSTIFRILRYLRAEGKIDYEVIDRQKSLYRKKDGFKSTNIQTI